MNAYWHRLGLTPTDDLVAIKRAYAARLKHTRPDDDAEAYQRLREAYDWAQGYARWCRAHPEAAEPADDEAPTEDVPAPTEADVGEPPARWWRADPLAAWVPAGIAAMGRDAARPLAAVPVLADAEPLASARWWRHRVPEYEADSAAPSALPITPALTAEAVIDTLRDWAETHGAAELGAAMPQLLARLDALPFAEQDAVNAGLAEFVLAHAEAPPALVCALAERFGWGQDFRLENLIGEHAALRLYERIEAAQAARPMPAPPRAEVLRARYAHLLQTARCHDTGRMVRFWLRVLLSPLALFDDARAPAAQALLDADDIAWRRIKRLIDRSFVLTLLTLAVGLSLLQGPDSRLTLVPVWALPALLLAGGWAGFALLSRLPGAAMAALHARLRPGRLGGWLARVRQGKSLYWTVFGLMVALAAAAFAAADVCLSAGLTGPLPELALAAAVGVLILVLLALVWPLGEAWGPLLLPAGLIVAAFIARAQSVPFAWAMALPAGFVWIVAANNLALCLPALAARVYLSPFSLLRPKNVWGWIAFAVFIKGVAAFYAAVFALGAPVALFAHARLSGWPRAYLALFGAGVLFFSGWLPLTGWAALLWLVGVLFVVSRLGKLADWLLARPLLALPG